MLWPHRYEMSVLITKKAYISDNMCAPPRRGLELNASNAQRLAEEPEKQAYQQLLRTVQSLSPRDKAERE